MKIFLMPLVSFFLCLQTVGAVECNGKQLALVIDSFVDKIIAEVPVTEEHILKALNHCSFSPSVSSELSHFAGTKDVVLVSPLFSEFQDLCQAISKKYPQTQSILVSIVDGVVHKLQQFEKKQAKVQNQLQNSMTQQIGRGAYN